MRKSQDFKISGSSGHYIMGIKALGKTGESYLKLWQFDRVPDIANSKYIRKGNECEQASMNLLMRKIGRAPFQNEKFFQDDYMQGTPDILLDDTVYDLKTSWDWSTFPVHDEKPESNYVIQLNIYMHLTGLRKAKLCHALVNASEGIVWDQIRFIDDHDRRARRVQELIFTEDEYERLRALHFQTSTKKFTEIPDSIRLKIWDISYNEELIEKLINRVKESRNILKSWENHFKAVSA